MKRTAKWIACSLTLVSTAMAAPARIEETLPHDTAFYARVALGPEFRKTPLWRLWNDPATAFLREGASRGALAPVLTHLEQGEGEAVLACFRPLADMIRGGEPVAGAAVPPAGGVFLVAVDDKPGNKGLLSLVDSIASAEGRKVRQEGAFRIESAPAAGTGVLVSGMTVCIARGKGRVVVGTEPDVLAFVRAQGSPPALSLASNPAFLAALAAAGGGGREAAFMYLDCGFLAALRDTPSADGLASFLKVGAVSLGIVPDGPDVRSALYVHAPGSPLLAAVRPAADDALLKYAPAGTLACGIFSLDARAAARTLAAGALAAGEAGREAFGKARAVRTFLDEALSVPTDGWLSAVGPQAGFYLTNSFPPSGCLVLKKGKTFDRVERILLAFLAAAEAVGKGDRNTRIAISLQGDGADHPAVRVGADAAAGDGKPGRRSVWKELAHRGRTVRYDANHPLQVGYAVDGEWVLVGPVFELKAALARADAGQPGLRESASFRKSRAGAPAGAHAFLWGDLSLVAPFLPLLAAAPGVDGPMRGILADPSKLGEVLAPQAIEAAATADGWVFRERGPLPLAWIALAAAARRHVMVEGAFPEDGTGVPVSGVEPGSNGEQAGIRAGDRILSYGGVEVSPVTLSGEIARSRPGTEVEVLVEREGERIALKVRGGERLGLTMSVGLRAGSRR